MASNPAQGSSGSILLGCPEDTGRMRREDKWIGFVEPHALTRINQRGITKQEVTAVLRRPDNIRRARQLGAKRFEKNFSKRKRIAVIVEETADTLWVMTAFPMK